MSRRNKKPQTAEFPDDTEIEGVANYDIGDPTVVYNKDPSKRYYFAAGDGDKSRPDGVARLEARGYKRSNAQHDHPSCVLMEIPRDVHDARKAQRMQRSAAAQRAVMKPPRGLEVQREDHGVKEINIKNGPE